MPKPLVCYGRWNFAIENQKNIRMNKTLFKWDKEQELSQLCIENDSLFAFSRRDGTILQIDYKNNRLIKEIRTEYLKKIALSSNQTCSHLHLENGWLVRVYPDCQAIEVISLKDLDNPWLLPGIISHVEKIKIFQDKLILESSQFEIWNLLSKERECVISKGELGFSEVKDFTYQKGFF